MEKMNVLIVNPALKKHSFAFTPPLALATLAAHIPSNHNVEITDENVSSLKFKDYDLVAISCMTDTVVRAYRIAEEFKKNGAKVVIGGSHVSALPNEAINHCDSVIIGEAESVWKEVIKDFENKSLKKFYYGTRLAMDDMHNPRRDLYSKRYLMQNIQTARGCPFQCEFCSVSAFSGKTYRQRPIKEVVDEMQTIRQKNVLFVDDNILGVGKNNEERAIRLFNGLKPLNKRFYAQTSVNVADNDKVLKAMSDTGMQGLLIGIESFNKENLKQMGKGMNVAKIQDYKKIIKKVHDNGILALGTIVFGYDHDTKETFQDAIDFIKDIDLDVNLSVVLKPLPGTRLYDRLLKEKRILHTNYPDDWEKYKGVVYQPKNMSPEELQSGTNDVIKSTSSFGYSSNRFFRSISITKDLALPLGVFIFNRLRIGWAY